MEPTIETIMPAIIVKYVEKVFMVPENEGAKFTRWKVLGPVSERQRTVKTERTSGTSTAKT